MLRVNYFMIYLSFPIFLFCWILSVLKYLLPLYFGPKFKISRTNQFVRFGGSIKWNIWSNSELVDLFVQLSCIVYLIGTLLISLRFHSKISIV